MQKTSKLIYFAATSLFFIIFDLFCTDIILKNSYDLPQNPIFDFVFVQNYGAAFNMFNGFRIFLISFSILAMLGIIYYTVKQIKSASTIAVFFVSMLISGIFTNMFERIAFGFVRDYIKLNFVEFPVFNLSDVFINISVFALIMIIIKNNFSNKKNETDC